MVIITHGTAKMTIKMRSAKLQSRVHKRYCIECHWTGWTGTPGFPTFYSRQKDLFIYLGLTALPAQ